MGAVVSSDDEESGLRGDFPLEKGQKDAHWWLAEARAKWAARDAQGAADAAQRALEMEKSAEALLVRAQAESNCGRALAARISVHQAAMVWEEEYGPAFPTFTEEMLEEDETRAVSRLKKYCQQVMLEKQKAEQGKETDPSSARRTFSVSARSNQVFPSTNRHVSGNPPAVAEIEEDHEGDEEDRSQEKNDESEGVSGVRKESGVWEQPSFSITEDDEEDKLPEGEAERRARAVGESIYRLIGDLAEKRQEAEVSYSRAIEIRDTCSVRMRRGMVRMQKMAKLSASISTSALAAAADFAAGAVGSGSLVAGSKYGSLSSGTPSECLRCAYYYAYVHSIHGNRNQAMKVCQAFILKASPFVDTLDSLGIQSLGWIHACLGYCHFSQQEYREAVKECRNAVKYAPKFVDAYVTCGASLQQIGEWMVALDWYNRAVKVDPSHAPAFSNRAALSSLRGDLKAAKSDLEQAFALGGSSSVSLWLNRAFYWNQSGKYEKAINDCTHVLEGMRVNHPYALSHRGYAYTMLKQYELAESDLNAALDANPDLIRALYNRSLLWYHREDFDQSASDVSSALGKAPTNPYLLAKCQQLYKNVLEHQEKNQSSLSNSRIPPPPPKRSNMPLPIKKTGDDESK